MQFYGLWEKNKNKKESYRHDYKFLDDDYIGYKVLDNGTKIYTTNEDEITDFEPNGRLKTFMEKYSLDDVGG